MVSRFQRRKFEQVHARYVIQAINSIGAVSEHRDAPYLVTWGERQNREASKIQTLARSLNKRVAIPTDIRNAWWPTHRFIVGRLEKRIGREKTRWYTVSSCQARQMNRRAEIVISHPRCILWRARGESESWTTNLRARTYTYATPHNILPDWPSAAMRAIRKRGFGKLQTSGPQERVTNLWELCLRYNAAINRDRIYGIRTIDKSRRGKLAEY